MSHQTDVAESSKTNNKQAAFDTVEGSETAPANGKPKLSVLIVDDAPGIRMIHNMLLKSFGPHLETRMAENGKVAVDLCRAGNHFDVIFMDNHMPVMDGIQATKELREMGVGSTIVGVSSCDLDYEVKPFMEAGLNECFEKPLTRAKVESVLEMLYRDG